MRFSAILMLTSALGALAIPIDQTGSLEKRASPKPPLSDAGVDFGSVGKRASPKPPLADAGVDFGLAEKRASP
ncbi:hypothetical protein BJ875DRAFT_361114, partial [Amylocarpus encephaloides]